jgi:eukaryotic-like serine/threonine-protein kinase
VASSKVDGRSDLYSAGIMLYELVAGQPPFTATEEDGPFTLMAKHVQAPPKPPSVFRPGLNLELERVILKSLSKRPEERYQTGQEFDHAMSAVADRMCPGWQRSLEPGADLSKMVPLATPAIPIPSPALGNTATAGSSRIAYNPTPPVQPVARRSLGCLSLIAFLAVAVSVGALAAGLVR